MPDDSHWVFLATPSVLEREAVGAKVLAVGAPRRAALLHDAVAAHAAGHQAAPRANPDVADHELRVVEALAGCGPGAAVRVPVYAVGGRYLGEVLRRNAVG